MITVKYFASLRERLGRGEDTLDGAGLATVADVRRALDARGTPVDNALCAVNLEYGDDDTSISDGDEIAFFPPVTGG